MAKPRVDHPAPFHPRILDAVAELLLRHGLTGGNLIDPFAGIGRVTTLKDRGFTGAIVCNELEPEWAKAIQGADFVRVGDARQLPQEWTRRFDLAVTSPTYGNRMADHHNAKDGSRRITYRHRLGRPLTLGNTGQLQWGWEYRALHEQAWAELDRVVRTAIVLNVKDHIRAGQAVPVTDWHVQAFQVLDWRVVERVRVPVDGMGFGANRSLRVEYENVILLTRKWVGSP